MNTRDSGRLQDLFDCLKKEERKRFPGWLENELQGRQQDMWEWFEQIWKQGSYADAWHQLYPRLAPNQAQINRWNTALVLWVEKFLAYCAFQEDTFAQLYYLNRAVIRRNPLKAYPSTIRKSRKHLQQQPIRDRTYFRTQHELDRLDGEFQILYPGTKIRRYQPDPQQHRLHEELAILMANVEVAVRRLTLGEALTELDQACMTRLRTYATDAMREQLPSAYLYCKIFGYLETQNPLSQEEGQHLLDWYQQHYPSLRSDAQFIVFTLINNLLVRSYFRREEPALIDLIFTINVWILEKTQIFGGRYFYRNVIQLSLLMAKKASNPTDRQKYLQQSHQYLEDLKGKLPIEDQEEAYNYNLAHLHFEEGAFDKLAKQLYSLKFKDYTYEISYLILWNQAQYELQQWEGLIERLKNLQISLRHTQRLGARFKKRQLNQVKYFRKLVINHRPTILRRLGNQLEQEEEVMGKEWLMQKIEEKIEAYS